MVNSRVIADAVAKAAGVSRSTVSRAFNPAASVAPKTRRRVLRIAEMMGYQPDIFARVLTGQPSNIVGIITGTLTNPFRSEVLNLLVERLRGEAFLPLLFKVNSREDIDDVMPSILQYKVSAVIVTGFTPSDAVAERCRAAETPMIILNRGLKRHLPATVVSCDHFGGGRLAAEALISDGCTRIAFVAGVRGQRTSDEREQGFHVRLAEAGMRPVAALDGMFTYEGGYAAATRIVGDVHPDAIFCASDLMAIGAIDAVRQQFGLKIPDDVAIIGFDDTPMSAWPPYNLTTIRQPVVAMIEAVLGFVGGHIDWKGNQAILLPPELIRRGTTRRPASDDVATAGPSIAVDAGPTSDVNGA